MKKTLFIFLILMLIPLGDLFHPGLPITHDGQDHIARIANFYLNLTEGIIIPRWAANLNWGYGHPILEFLYPLPSYLASFFHSLNFSLINSTKIVFGIGMFFSGIAMYLWLSCFLDDLPAFIGGLLYVYAPYRFVELYVRGDVGENLAFVFVPLVLYFIFKLFEGNKKIHLIGGSLSLACLILSHNAIALMFIPFVVFYCGYLIYISKDKKPLLLNTILIMLFGFGLSAFFWIPGLFEGKYTLRNIVTHGEYAKRFVSFSDLIYGKWSYGGSGQFTVQFGLIHWLFFLSTPIIAYFGFLQKRKAIWLISSLFIYTLIAIFLMLPVSNFLWSRFLLLQNFQFPWRFLAIPVFTLSALGACACEYLLILNIFNKSHKRLKNVIVAALIIVIIHINARYWHANGFLYKPDGFFSNVYDGTTDTGESAPIWSIRFMEHRPMAHMEFISGDGSIKELSGTTTKHVYQIVTMDKNARLRENTLYFPGWEVRVDDLKTNIEFQDPKNRGIITFFIAPGMHNIVVSYKETKLRLIADYISLISVVFLFVIIAFSRKKPILIKK